VVSPVTFTREAKAYRICPAARKALRAALPGPARQFIQPMVAELTQRRLSAELDRTSDVMSQGPLIVSGLLAEAKGVSQGARLSVDAFKLAGLAPVLHDIPALFEYRGDGTAHLPSQQQGGVWFVHVNAPEAIHALARLKPVDWRNRYRIGYWAYELPRIPASWVRAAAAFHEIWSPSRFVVDALRSSGVKVPVRSMPHPVALGSPPATPQRERFGIPADAFAVLTLADLRSSATRKNLLGAISIYLKTFPSPSPMSTVAPVRLIVKVREDKVHPAFLARARHAARGRPDIQFITGDLSADDMRGLIASCSLVLSPHRAEGFGLPLAEALMAGCPCWPPAGPAMSTSWRA